VWGGWLSKKPFQKELAMHRLTFDPGQRRVLLLVTYIKNITTCKHFSQSIRSFDVFVFFYFFTDEHF
jgi:hypothetical protein